MADNVTDKSFPGVQGARVYKGDKSVINWADLFSGTFDVFNKMIADGTSNETNLASHYPYSPERWRIFKGSNATGNRLFPEYGAVPEYNHAGDVHELIPAAGETIIFESAERYRYIVDDEMQGTWSMGTNQPLVTGDYIRCGMYDGTDGWFLEHNGSHDSKQCDVVMLRDGTELYRETASVENVFTRFHRFSLQTAWYGIARQEWGESFSELGEQINNVITKVSYDQGRGPKKGNLNLRYEVNASPSTTGLVLEAGSTSMTTLGSPQSDIVKRAKGFYDEQEVTSTTGYVPLGAFRGRDGYEVVNTQLSSVQVLSYTQDTTVEMVVMAFDESKVTFTGADNWGIPSQWNTVNNALEYRGDVDTVANRAGVLEANPTFPGGYQIGHAVLTPVGGDAGQFQKGTQSNAQRIKRNLNNGDIAVMLATADLTGTIGFDFNWEQDF